MNDLIEKTEREFDELLSFACEKIIEKGSRIVFTAGPSCAGKTTLVKLLSKKIEQTGRVCHTVSLDDFYRYGDEIVYLEDGSPDFESIQSLRLDLVVKCIRQINDYERVSLPAFDFLTQTRSDDVRVIEPVIGDIFIIEGLHALNPRLLQFSKRPFKLFLYVEAPFSCGVDPRLVRRIVRDIHFRGTKPYDNFLQWDKVIAEEAKSIIPFAYISDLKLNTYYAYERGVLAPIARGALDEIPYNSVFAPLVKEILKYLDGAEDIPLSEIPENSLLKEFV